MNSKVNSMTTLFTNIAHCLKKLKKKNHHILMALGEQELQQAPNKNVPSLHLMLMSGLTIFFLFWIHIIFSSAHKLGHYKTMLHHTISNSHISYYHKM